VPESVDVAIVGAGAMGASIAFHLAERGAGSVLVLDERHVASGATGSSSGLVRMHYTFPPEVRLALASLDYFESWEDRFGRPSTFRRTGFVRIVPPSQAEHLRANVVMQRECGVHTRVVTRAELRELEPGWWLDDLEVAAWEPDSGYADAAAVASDFLACARERGVRYRPGCRVQALRVERGRVSGVETDSGFVAAGTVVVAAGAWSRGLLQQADLDLPLECEYHEVVILERPAGCDQPDRACVDSSLGIYFRPEGPGQALVGGFEGPRSLEPRRDVPEPEPDALEGKLRRAVRRIPALADAGIVRSVTGYYTMTPDRRALLGPLPDVERLFCCTGFSGMGFKVSPAIGLVMSEWILDGRSRTVDVAAFRPDRFARGEPIHPPHEYEIDRLDLDA
jgi:glycine/D-amino acid oxidase-like deaminating enzyme